MDFLKRFSSFSRGHLNYLNNFEVISHETESIFSAPEAL